MSLTLVQSPSAVSLSRNRAPFKWAMVGADSLRVGTGRGARAFLQLDNTFAVTDGDSVTVNFTGGSVTFFIADSPSTENDILSYSGAFDVSAYLFWYNRNFFAAIKTHRLIAPFFDVEATGTDFQLVLICKDRESALNPSFTVSSLPGATTSTATADTDNRLDNHAVLYNLYLEKTYKGGDWENIFDGKLTADTEGYALTDTASIIDEHLTNLRRERIPKSLTTPYFTNLNVRRFYLRYLEQSGTPVTTSAVTNSGSFLVLHAGMPMQADRDFGFIAALTANNSFLTNLPNDLIVSAAQPNYISWINYTGAAVSAKMLVSYTLADGSTVLNQPIANNAGLNSILIAPYETVTFNISAANIAMPDDCISFTIRVFNVATSAPMSAVRRYFVPGEYAEHERFLQFFNGFGVPECVRVTGALTTSTEIDRLTNEYTDAYNVSQTEQTQATFRQPMIYRTGYINRALMDALNDALIRNNVFEVTTEGYIPLLITDKKTTSFDSDTVLFALDIEAVPAIDYNNFGTIAFNTSGNTENQNVSWMSVAEQTWRRVWMVKW